MKSLYILFGVLNGGIVPGDRGGISRIPDTHIPVAIFEDFDEAEQYISDNRLKNPNYSKGKVFFKKSLLNGFDKAYVLQKEIPVFMKPEETDEAWLVSGNDGAIFDERQKNIDWSGGWGRDMGA